MATYCGADIHFNCEGNDVFKDDYENISSDTLSDATD